MGPPSTLIRILLLRVELSQVRVESTQAGQSLSVWVRCSVQWQQQQLVRIFLLRSVPFGRNAKHSSAFRSVDSDTCEGTSTINQRFLHSTAPLGWNNTDSSKCHYAPSLDLDGTTSTHLDWNTSSRSGGNEEHQLIRIPIYRVIPIGRNTNNSSAFF